MAAPGEAALVPEQKASQRSLLSHIWWRRELLINELRVIARTCLTHAIWGPPFDTWTLELHLLTEIVRESAKPAYNKHSSLKGLRAVTAIDKRMGIPKHLRNYRRRVPMKKRGLKGILEQTDEAETGESQVEGEWIVHDGVEQPRSRVVFFLHGGAYVSMSVATHRPLCLAISKALQCRIYSVEYGLAPEHPYPQAIYQAISAYMDLLDQGIPAENIVFAGDSAGGGLAVACLMYIGENNLPKPSGGLLLSPWLDLEQGLASHEENRKFDYITRPFDSTPVNPVRYYIGDRRPEDTPYAAPIFASNEQLANLPPLLIQSGALESLRDESVLFAARAPPGSRLEIFDHGVHVFHFFLLTPASVSAIAAMASFEATLAPPKPYDFGSIDAQLTVKKAANPSKAVPPPRFTFAPAQEMKKAPRPATVEKAPARLKQLVAEWQQIPDYHYYQATWDVKPRSTLTSWAHL